MAMCIKITKTNGHLNVIEDVPASVENKAKPFKSIQTVGEPWPMCYP
jgi:hypothetical protein